MPQKFYDVISALHRNVTVGPERRIIPGSTNSRNGPDRTGPNSHTILRNGPDK